MDVGTTPEGTIWFRVRPAVQFARGFLNPESAKTLLSKMISEDGVPDGFRKGLWKVGAAKREAGKGSWSFQFATLRNVVKTQVLHARGAPANNARAHVVIPDDVQVQDFLDRCQEAGRQVLEKKIVAENSAVRGPTGRVASARPSCHPTDRARPRAPGVGKREGHIHRRRHPQAPGPILTVLHA
jgi:hypothetical protein